MENGKRDKSLEAKRLVKDEYDMVPTRLKPVSATANGLTFTTQMEPGKSRSAMPRESRIPGRSQKKNGTFDPSRVKSSIPTAGPKQETSYRQRKTKENAANYVEELKRVETERAVKVETE